MDSLTLSTDDAGLLIASYFAGYTLVNLTAIALAEKAGAAPAPKSAEAAV